MKNVLSNIIEICMKYSDYLTKNKHIQAEYQVNDKEELQHKKAIFQLPTLENLKTYKVEQERNTIVSLKEVLEDKTFTSQLVLIFIQRYQYVFIWRLKKFGIPINNAIIFAQYYLGSHGNLCGVKTLIQMGT